MQKKYKHKITGFIATETTTEKNYRVSEPKNFTVPKWIIEDSNDWIEIVEKDYEILSFISITNSIFNKNSKDNTFGNNCNNCKDLLNDKGFKIHSVKRLSDGEIFTIGDKVDFNGCGVSTLKEMHISTAKSDEGKNILCFVPDSIYLGKWWNINELIKAPIPLFTTEDGIDIFEENHYPIYTVYDKSFDMSLNTAKGSQMWYQNEKNISVFGINPHCKAFSTKEKAEEYALMNKPCLSIKEFYSFSHLQAEQESTFEKLKELVKSKL